MTHWMKCFLFCVLLNIKNVIGYMLLGFSYQLDDVQRRYCNEINETLNYKAK